MTTITVDNPIIENNYSAYEIKLKFINFIEKEIKDERINLYEISVDDLPTSTKEVLKNLNNLDFIEY